MRRSVAKRLKRLATVSGKSYRGLKRTWDSMPRNAPRPGRTELINVPIPSRGPGKGPRFRMLSFKVAGRSVAGIDSAIARVKASTSDG